MTNPMTKLQTVYLSWQNLKPHNGGSCCKKSHFFTSETPEKVGKPKPDEMCCRREVSWRQYVRLRDNSPGWPFTVSRLIQ